ncbi:hypothetical protein [Corynebacterium amycolatum]
MKSIAQIVQNNLRLLAAYQDKVQPRFLSRYAREPMDAAVDGLGAGRNSTSPTSSRRSRESPAGPMKSGCDLIVVLSEDGTVAERGTHDELLAKGGRYAESWTTTTTASEKRG